MSDDTGISRATNHYPPAEITPAEFEEFVTTLFESAAEHESLSNLRVKTHDVIEGVDGSFDFDVTVRYELAGSFLSLSRRSAIKTLSSASLCRYFTPNCSRSVPTRP